MKLLLNTVDEIVEISNIDINEIDEIEVVDDVFDDNFEDNKVEIKDIFIEIIKTLKEIDDEKIFLWIVRNTLNNYIDNLNIDNVIEILRKNFNNEIDVDFNNIYMILYFNDVNEITVKNCLKQLIFEKIIND